MVMMTILIEHGYWKPTNQSGFILDHDIKIMKRIFDDHDKDHDNQDHKHISKSTVVEQICSVAMEIRKYDGRTDTLTED